MRRLAFWFASFGIAVAAASQSEQDGWARVGDGHAFRSVEVDVGAIGVSVAWDSRRDGDPGAVRALSHAAAMHRAACADRVLPERVRTQLEVGEGFCLFSLWLPEDAAGLAPSWLAALCGPFDLAADSDRIDRSLSLAALAADDAQWLFPGEVLQTTLRRAAFRRDDWRSAGPLGDPATLLATSAAEFVALLAAPAPGGLRVAFVGAVRHSEAVRKALAAIPCGAAPVVLNTSPGLSQSVPLAFAMHPRVDAHYVACAMPSPATDSSLQRLCAVEVLRVRARARFQSPRGNEALARAPFVQHEALLGDPLLVLCRRGVQGSPADLPRQELEDLVGAMSLPTQASEFAAASAIVRAEHPAPPFHDGQVAALRAAPAALATRARSLVLLGRLGIQDRMVRALAEVRPESVEADLRAFASGSKFWAGLAPTRVDPSGG